MTSVRSESPGTVHHWFARLVELHRDPVELAGHPVLGLYPRVRPRHALSPVAFPVSSCSSRSSATVRFGSRAIAHEPKLRSMSVLIKGGRVVTAADDYIGDVFVDGERVTLIGESLDVQADRVIDATGKYVLPGGIDVHTHMDSLFGGTTTADNHYDGTVSGAFGGTTDDRRLRRPGRRAQTFAEGLDEWHAKIETSKPVIDVGFHMAVTDLKERRHARRAGARCPTRASRATSSSWPTRARSWSTTRRSSRRCRSRPRTAHS